jgi:hypothetical protein
MEDWKINIIILCNQIFNKVGLGISITFLSGQTRVVNPFLRLAVLIGLNFT